MLAAIATIGTLSGLYEWQSRRLIMEAETRADLQLVQTLGNMLWPRHGSFIQIATSMSKEQLVQHPEQALLLDSVRYVLRDSPVLKVKIFAPKTGVTLFSTEAKQVGDNKHDSQGLIAALKGEKNAELTHRESFNAIGGVVKNRDVVASYIPFYENGRTPNGSPEMILEVYSDVTELLLSHTKNLYCVGCVGCIVIDVRSNFLFRSTNFTIA
jgi:hypothetical protein